MKRIIIIILVIIIAGISAILLLSALNSNDFSEGEISVKTTDSKSSKQPKIDNSNEENKKTSQNNLSETDSTSSTSNNETRNDAETKKERKIMSFDEIYFSALNLFERQDYRAAEQALNELLENKNDYTEAYLLLGNIEIKKKNYNRAINYLEKGSRLAKQNNFTNLFIEFLLKKIDLYVELSDYDKVIALCNQCKKLTDDIKYRASVTVQLGEIYLVKKDLQLALKNFEEAKKLIINNIQLRKKFMIRIYFGLASVYKFLNESIKALNNFTQLIQFAQDEIGSDNLTTEDTYLEAVSLNQIGIIYFQKKQYDSAVDYLRRAVNYGERISIDDNSLIAFYNNLSSAYEKIGEIEEAKSYLRKAIEIEEKIQHPNLENDKRHYQFLEEKS